MTKSSYIPEHIKPTTDQLQISPQITLAVGDDVKCSPKVGKSYVGKIKAIVVNESGEVVAVDVEISRNARSIECRYVLFYNVSRWNLQPCSK